MQCTVCRSEVPEGAPFCPNCGTRVAQPSPAPSSSAGAPTLSLPSLPTTDPAPEPRPAPEQTTPVVPPSSPTSGAVPAFTMPQYYGPPAVENSTLAVVSLVFGILAWTVLPLVGAFVAVITGHMGRSEIRRSEGRLGGFGMTTAGLILGYLQLALMVLGCVGFALLVAIGASVSS